MTLHTARTPIVVYGALLLVLSACAAETPSTELTEAPLLNVAGAYVATWETNPPTSGTLSSGSYVSTQADDTTYEQLAEKRAKTSSPYLLSHTWKITDLPSGAGNVLRVVGSKLESGGDTFMLSWAPATGTGSAATCGTYQAFSPACSISAVAPAETTCATALSPTASVVCVRVNDSTTTSDTTLNRVRIDYVALVDTIAPDTVITSGPPALTSATTATFAFSATGGAASYQCALDGAAFAACASGATRSGLAAGAHVFAVRAIDAAGNADPSPASHAWSIDLTPPAAVTDLRVTGSDTNSLTLAWTSPGDNGQVGNAASYALRIATTPITSATWGSATVAGPPPAPASAGTTQTVVLGGLVPSTTYYVALRATDAAGNIAALSNVPSGLTVVPPDLVAEALVAPVTVAPGQVANLTWTGRNAGAGVANGAWESYIWDQHYYWWDRVYVSTDAAYSADDVLVGSYEKRDPLAGGGSYAAAIAPQFPSVPDGNYYLLVVADRDGLVAEADDANNVAAARPISVVRGDLVAEAFTAPATVAPGEAISLSWTGRNVGAGVANGAWEAYIWNQHFYWWDRVYVSTDAAYSADDVLVGSYEKRDPLAGGGSYAAAIAPQFPRVPAGDYYLLVVADKDGLVSETSEVNNAVAVPVSVVPIDGPLLSLGAADWRAVKSPGFAPDGGRLVVADGVTARIWELGTFTELSGYAGHTAELDSASFAPSGAQVLTAARDGTAALWDTLTLETIRTFGGSPAGNVAAQSRDGSLALVSNGAAPKLYRVATGELVATLNGHTAAVTAAAFSADGTRVVTASLDDTARIWDTTTGAQEATLAHPADVNDVAVAPVGDQLATASADGKIRLWTASSGAAVRVIDQRYPVGHADYSADGAYLVSSEAGVSSTRAAQAYLWDLSQDRKVRAFATPHETACPPAGPCTPHSMNAGSITGLALSPDRTLVALTQGNGRIRLFATGLAALPVSPAIELTVGVAAPAHVAPNQTLTYRFQAIEGSAYVVRLAATPTAAATYAAAAGADPLAVDLRLGEGAVPTPAHADAHAVAHASSVTTGAPLVRAVGGGVYVTLTAPMLTSGALDGTLVVEAAPGVAVAATWPRQVGNAGAATVAVTGAGLNTSSQVALVGAATINATGVTVLDDGRLAATFDLAGAAVGSYAVVATDPATQASATLAGAVEVRAGTGGALTTWIEGPTVLRPGTTRTFTVHWRNDGDADVEAPLLSVQPPAGGVIVNEDGIETTLRMFFAGADGHRADVVPPGATGAAAFNVRMPSTAQPAQVALRIGRYDASHATDLVGWGTLRGRLAEVSADPDFGGWWDATTGAIGPTWGQLVAAMREVLPEGQGPIDLETVLMYTMAYRGSLESLGGPAASVAQAQARARAEAPLSDPTLGGVAPSTDVVAAVTPADVTLWVWDPAHGFRLADPSLINHGWPTVNIIHGSFTDMHGAAGAYLDQAAEIFFRYNGQVNIVFSDWSAVASPIVRGSDPNSTNNKFRGGFKQAVLNAGEAGQLLAARLRALGLTDIVHVTHSHGRFVAEAIARFYPTTEHGLLSFSPGSILGSDMRRPDYSLFKLGSYEASNLFSWIDDHGLRLGNQPLPDARALIREALSGRYGNTWKAKVSDWHAGGPRFAARLFGRYTPHEVAARSRAGLFGRAGSTLLGRFAAGFLIGAVEYALCSVVTDSALATQACMFGMGMVELALGWGPWSLLIQGTILLVQAIDPEELVGPAPSGAAVSRASPWAYDLNIWNHADATAPVQEIVAVTYLDPALDGSTLDLGTIQFGERTLAVPPGVTSWSWREIPENDGCSITGTAVGDLAVDVAVGFDPITRRLEWRLKVVDTGTGLAPLDPYAGILPPPDDQLCGRAHLTYEVLPRTDTADGEAIQAEATVVFDGLEPSTTAPVFHVVAP